METNLETRKYWVYSYADTFGDSIEAQNNLEVVYLTEEEFREIKEDEYDIFDNLEDALKFARGE